MIKRAMFCIRLGKAGEAKDAAPGLRGVSEFIDGNWFPAYARMDDTLHFRAATVRIKESVKFTALQKEGLANRGTEAIGLTSYMNSGRYLKLNLRYAVLPIWLMKRSAAKTSFCGSSPFSSLAWRFICTKGRP